MKRLFVAFTFGVLWLGVPAAGKEPPQDILGIHLDMPKPAAHARLSALGTLQRQERKRQEIWTIRDERFRSIMIGYDEHDRVRYVTALTRDEGRRVRYSDVASPDGARHDVAGKSHTYTWMAKQEKGDPYLVIAIGRDPQYLTYVSLKRPAG